MARKKKKKSGGLFGIFSKKKKKTKRSKRKSSDSFASGLKVTLSILFLTILVAGGAITLIYMDRYVNHTVKMQSEDGGLTAIEGPLKLIDAPAWLTPDWTQKIVAIAGGERFELNQTSAKLVADRLSGLSWLDNVQAQTTPEYLEIRADYRKPIALVQKSHNQKVYLDIDMVVLDYIPLDRIPIVEIMGLASKKLPDPGHQWAAEDAAAAVKLLNFIYLTDLHFEQERKNPSISSKQRKIPGKPLLNEIESIDVSNFGARKSRSAPNLVLNVVDGTKIYWGAAWGESSVYFEAAEKEKLARLYQYFMDHQNTLQGTAKRVELRWPQDRIPRPR
jgi:hypothetical protein